MIPTELMIGSISIMLYLFESWTYQGFHCSLWVAAHGRLLESLHNMLTYKDFHASL